jgi:hypothetical protein
MLPLGSVKPFWQAPPLYQGSGIRSQESEKSVDKYLTPDS